MKLDIMGLQFDNVTMDEASARAEQILAGKKTCYAVTPNAEIAYEALYDETLRALINGADQAPIKRPSSAYQGPTRKSPRPGGGGLPSGHRPACGRRRLLCAG